MEGLGYAFRKTMGGINHYMYVLLASSPLTSSPPNPCASNCDCIVTESKADRKGRVLHAACDRCRNRKENCSLQTNLGAMRTNVKKGHGKDDESDERYASDTSDELNDSHIQNGENAEEKKEVSRFGSKVDPHGSAEVEEFFFDEEGFVLIDVPS